MQLALSCCYFLRNSRDRCNLYGVLDAGVTVSKVHGGDTKVQMSNGNWMGNRWGIKGSEDLGSGNSVFFKLEQGYKLSNGNEGAEGKALQP